MLLAIVVTSFSAVETNSISLIGLPAWRHIEIAKRPGLVMPMGIRNSLRGVTPNAAPKGVEVSAAGPTYKLAYFDIRGLAETPRMLFALGKTPFEDIRMSVKFGVPGDFSSIQRPEFDAAKASGDLDASLGKLPYLEVDGQKIGQSKAIERYLARKFGLLGENDVDAAIIDQICESVVDFRDAFSKARTVQGDAEKAAAMEKWFTTDMPEKMKLLEKSLPPSGSGPFLMGSKVSLADVVLYQFCAAPGNNFDNQFVKNATQAQASFQDCPRIVKAMKAVAAIPELQVYMAARPERPF